MDDSWQKLMGLDCGSDDGPSSPVFHKKKWVVLPTSLKRSGSRPLLAKIPEKKLKNKRENDSKTSAQVFDRNSTMPPEDKSLKNSTVDEDDPPLIYSTTPTKSYKQKRKTIDLLSCSFRTEVSVYKKSKLNDDYHSELSNDSSNIKLEKNCSEQGEETEIPTLTKLSPMHSKKTNLASKPQRKLLYSCNEKNSSSLKTPTVTVNDIIKSVIMIDEADIHSSPKKNRPILTFEVQSNDFQNVTSLNNENLKNCSMIGNHLVSSPSSSALENCNDSFGDCMFTEVENKCLSSKNIFLNPNCKKVPLTSNGLAIPDDGNPMDESFSNYRFTEIEEDYACLSREGLKDSNLVTSSLNSAQRGPFSSYSSPQNKMGRNTCSDVSTSHKSTVLNKTVEANPCTLDNKGDEKILDGNNLENSYLKSCSDDNDIFNCTISPLKSMSKLETVTDKECFLSTSKECFNDLDAVSTEEFRNNQLADHHHESNTTLKEDFLNQSIENPEKYLHNKSFSKLDATLTDIMQQLLNKRVNNESKPYPKNQNLDKHVVSYKNSSLNDLNQDIKYKEESKIDEVCDQTSGNISSECSPEKSNLLPTNEIVFLTQEYLENVKPEVSLDTSVVYYQQSFDYMISAEVKSRLSGNNFVIPPVKQESSLLNRSLSSDICIMADDKFRSPNDSFICNNDENTVLNKSNASNLNRSIIENTIKSPICSDNLNNSCEIKLTQCELFSDNLVVNYSPDLLSTAEDPEKNNDVKNDPNKVHNDINNFSNKTPLRADVSGVNIDLISQGSLQQFNYSFQLEPDDLDVKKEEKNLNNHGSEDINVNNVYSNSSASIIMNAQNTKISKEFLINDKSKCKDIVEESILINQEDNAVSDRICYEDSDFLVKKEKNVDSVNLKNVSSDKFINEYNEHSTKCLSEIKNNNVNQWSHCLVSGTDNSTHRKINNNIQEIVHPVLLQKPCAQLAHQKSDADYSFPSALGKNSNTTAESLRKIRSVLSHDLDVINQENVKQCVPDSTIINLNFHTEKNNTQNMDLTESSSSFNTTAKDIDNSKSDIEENELKTDNDLTFKSPLARPYKGNSFMFSSAGGKKIKVSKNALAKVKSMFNEILELDPTENKDTADKSGISQVNNTSLPSSSKSTNLMSSSKCNRNIKVSGDALNKLESNFSKIPESDPTRSKNIEDINDNNEAFNKFKPCLSKYNNFMFSSAGGKKITISDDALIKVKSKFNEIFESSSMEVDCDKAKMDIDHASNTFVSSSSKNDNLLISWSNSNKIMDSENELAKAKSKLNEISERYMAEDRNTDNKSYTNEMFKTTLPSSSTNDNFMFSTAGGKNIKVSDVALSKIKSKFNDIMESIETEAIKDLGNDPVAKNHSQDKTVYPSLKTRFLKPDEAGKISSANGKNTIVLENTLAQVKSKGNDSFERSPTEWENAEAETDIDQTYKTSSPISIKTDRFMFSTAGGKNITVSDVAFAKVKSKFNEIMDSFETGYQKAEDIKNTDQESKISLPDSCKSDNLMFSSAGDKNIQVSECSVANVKSKFSELFQSSLTDVDFSKGEKDIILSPKTSLYSFGKPGNSMFSSASGNNIEVSDDALARVKSKFNEIVESHNDVVVKDKTYTNIDLIPKKVLPCSSKASNFMFTSASGKNIEVSDDALARVKSKFNEIMESHDDVVVKDKTNTNIDLIPKKVLSCSGKASNFMFTSASGKNSDVSDDALAKVKAKFNEIIESHDDVIVKDKTNTNIDLIPKKVLPCSGKASNFMFTSVSGKNIDVSDDALAKVKAKFNEITKRHEDVVIKNEADKNIDQIPKTFFTSSGKTSDFMFSSANSNNVNFSENELAIVESNIDLTPTSFPKSGKAGNLMFSSASGKNITVSDDALAKVKSKFKEILNSNPDEVKNNETESDVKPVSKSFYTRLEKADNLIFSSTTGNNINVCEVAKSKARLYEYSGNNLLEGENEKIEENECQLLETTFSCFDKSDPFSLSINETEINEIPDKTVGMKSKLNGILKDNSTQFEFNQSRDVLDGLPKIPSSITNKNDNSTPFSPNFSSSMNVIDDKLWHGNRLESFPSIPNNNEMECEINPDKYSEVKLSTARGEEISVSEDTLIKVRSEFSEVIDNKLLHLSDGGNINDYCVLHANSPSKIYSDEMYLNPALNEIVGCLAQTPKNIHLLTKDCMNKKLSNNLNQNDRKSKSSHSGNSTSHQPLAKKVCFQPGIVNLPQKLSANLAEHKIGKESKIQCFTFTQSIPQSILDTEIDIIEKIKCPREILNLNDNESNSKPDECFENKDLVSDKCNSQIRYKESDMTIYELSDSAAAFMADCTPDRSVISSPSSFFNRKSMKPMKLLEMEFDDVDDEIMVAAELKIIPEKNIKNQVSTIDSLDSISFRSCSNELLSIRNDQRKRIDVIINQKLKQRPPSSPGLYMTLRNGGSLKRISENLQPFLVQEQLYQLGLKEEILFINSTNAEKFDFCAESFFSYEECFSKKGIIDLGYGFSLILSDDNKIGLNEISKCFFANPNVDPSFVSSAWIKNHFKWIVWKLAGYERSFPKQLANRYLIPENVLHQLKYRYDREIDLAQRPAIKKILECDEPSSRRLIACVADIRNVDISDNESNYEIELTDGWYSVWACIDPAMKILIDQKKVKIGTKLIFQAAELLNCTEGCDPLEINNSVRLKLHTNCARRVKWHTKMGFTRYPGPIRISLNSILHNGGLVGLTSAIIARVYPLLYMSKDADGKTILRNAHAEHHASSLKENYLTIKSEELFEKLFPEVEAKYKNGVVKFDKNSISKIKDPALLWKIVSNESDPTEVQSLMTPDQLLEVRKYHELISSKIREEVQALVKKKLAELLPSQNAKCLLKLRLLDPVGSCNALLTVWNPSEDLLQILVEKKCFDFYALNASGIRDKVLQLSSTNRTIYKEKNVMKPIKEFERKVTAIYDIVANSVSAQFGEVDVVGTVIFVKEPEKPWGVTNVYLSDSQESFLMITFWTSLKTLGCDDTLKLGSTVACINLQWRQGSGSYVIPSTYANEMTYFSTNPNQDYLINALQEIKSSISLKNLDNFIIERRRTLFTILKEREYNSKTPISRVETPKVLKRLENLKKYGEASSLPKLSLQSSPDIHKKFRSPKSGAL